MMRFVISLVCLFVSMSCGQRDDHTTPIPAPSVQENKQEMARKRIVFFGDSITAGYGLEPGQDYTALLQRRIDSLGLPYTVVNAGVSGETTSGGLGRIDWLLKQPVDVFVLELGANDGLRGVATAQVEANLQEIIDKVQAAYPKAMIIVAGMQVPPSMGQRYAHAFAEVFPRVAKKNDATLIPFLLDGVGGEQQLNQDDGIHPNAEGAKIVADNVWKYLDLAK